MLTWINICCTLRLLKLVGGYKMKKLLTIVLLCLISFGIFAEHRPITRSISVRVRTGAR